MRCENGPSAWQARALLREERLPAAASPPASAIVPLVLGSALLAFAFLTCQP